jgi:predicted permease
MRLDPASPSWGRSSHWLLGVGRLAPGATQQAFEAELTYFGRTWAETYPDHHVGHGLIARDLRRDLVGDTRMPLLVLTGAVGLVFIAIAVNLVGLSVTRAEGRRREIAVRVALGAGRGRIARQLLLECLTIAVTGGLLGLIGAAWLIDAILAFYPGELPRAEAVRLDLAVAGVSLALSVLTGLVLAAASLWSATRFGPAEAIRASSRTASASGSSVRLRRALVVGQVAIGLSLVLAATLLVRAYVRITRTDLGFDPKDVVTFALTLPEPDYPTGDAVRRLVSDMTVRLGALPGVEAAGGVSALPLVSAGPPDDFMVEGRPAVRPGEPGLNARALTVTPGWFPALRVPLLRGRLLDDRDNAQAPLVAVINQAAARKYWPGEDPIGQRIRYYGPRDPWLTVVGIVGDLRSQSPTAAPEPAVYMPHAQPARETQTIRELSVTVRSRAGAPAAGPAIRAQVAALDPALPITELVPMTRVAIESVGDRRFTMLLMAAFAGVALLLSALGLYGVLTHLVQLRTREIGIRMALGASQVEVMRRVMGEGLALALAGVGLGLCLSLAGQRALSHLLFGISPGDPVTLAGVAVGLLVVAMVACLVPVRRASRVDPMTALRAE